MSSETGANHMVERFRRQEPQQAVLSAFGEVERLLQELARQYGLDPTAGALRIAYGMDASGLIPQSGRETVFHLKLVRDLVAHGGARLTAEQLDDYLATVGTALVNLAGLRRPTTTA